MSSVINRWLRCVNFIQGQLLKLPFFLLPVLCVANNVYAQNVSADESKAIQAENAVEKQSQPLYTPFVERYVLDELKQLRIDMAQQKHELMQQVLDREHSSIDRAVTYSTDTITYFFYLIAAATSVLVLVGWTSIRDMKERVHSLADEEISRLVQEYEKRLENIESQLRQKTQHIEENREEIERTQEAQSLWLRAGQETSAAVKISIYDQILILRSDDCEALTYKADAVLELNEPQWAVNLCLQALQIDPANAHAFYQLACAYTVLEQPEQAVVYLKRALKKRESFREDIIHDEALTALHSFAPFRALMGMEKLDAEQVPEVG